MPTQIQVSSESDVSIIATCFALIATIWSLVGVSNSRSPSGPRFGSGLAARLLRGHRTHRTLKPDDPSDCPHDVARFAHNAAGTPRKPVRRSGCAPPVCDQFGIEFPLFAFSHCRDVVAAVSRAGGFGVLGALRVHPGGARDRARLDRRARRGQAVRVDLVMPANYVGKGRRPAQCEELRAMIPAEYWEFTDKILSEFGVPPLPDDYDERARAAGTRRRRPGHPRGRDRPQARARQAPGQRARPAAKEVVDKAHEHGISSRRGRLEATTRRSRSTTVSTSPSRRAPRPVATPATFSTMVLVPEVVDAVGPTCRSSRPAASAPAVRWRQGCFGRARRLDRLDLASPSPRRTPPARRSRTFSPRSRATVRSPRDDRKPARQSAHRLD